MADPLTLAEVLAGHPELPRDRIPVCYWPRPGVAIECYFDATNSLPASGLRFRRREGEPLIFDLRYEHPTQLGLFDT